MLRCTLLGLAVAAGIGFADDDKNKEQDKNDNKPKIKWTKTLKESLEAARSGDKIVMVDIYTDWCGWCKELDKKTYVDEAVVKICNEQLISCKLDGEKGEGVAVVEKFKIQGFPAILFLDGSGQLVGKISGFRPPKPFLQSVTVTLKAHRDLPALLARVKENPSDLEASIRLAEIFSTRGEKTKAKEFLDLAEKHAQPGDVNMAKGYNAVADVYQEAEEFDTAIELFNKAIKASENAEQQSYGQGSIAACYWSMKKFKECREAAQKTIAIKGGQEDMIESCKAMIEEIKKLEERIKKERDAKKAAAKKKAETEKQEKDGA